MERAQNKISVYLTIGILAILIGGAVIGLGYPHTAIEEASYPGGSDSAKDVGSATAVIIGAFIVGVGQIFFFIGAIGKGVQLGTDAANR